MNGRPAALTMTAKHRWLLDYLIRECSGLDRAEKRDRILERMREARSASGQSLGWQDTTDSEMRILKEELMALRYLVGSCPRGWFRPMNREEARVAAEEYRRRRDDASMKYRIILEIADELYGGQERVPGTQPSTGEAA